MTEILYQKMEAAKNVTSNLIKTSSCNFSTTFLECGSVVDKLQELVLIRLCDIVPEKVCKTYKSWRVTGGRPFCNPVSKQANNINLLLPITKLEVPKT